LSEFTEESRLSLASKSLSEADAWHFLRGAGETSSCRHSVVLSLGVLTSFTGSSGVNDSCDRLPDAVPRGLCLVGAVIRGYSTTKRGLTASQDCMFGCLRVGLAGVATGGSGKGDTSSASLRSSECSVAGSVSSSGE